MDKPDAAQRAPTSNDELQRRRRDIDRGLRRSHYAVVAASGLIGLFALAALWLGAEARHRATDAHLAQRLAETNAADARGASMRLWEFSSHAAREQRLRRAVGQRTETLDIIREAARFQPSRELRDEALSALLLPDIGTNLVWYPESSFEIAATYDADLEHFIQNCDHGHAIVRRAKDGAALLDDKTPRQKTRLWQFSPDGRLAAIAYLEEGRSQVGILDWRRTNLVAVFQAMDARFNEPPFDFSPDGKEFWVLSSDRLLACYDLQTREPMGAIVTGNPAHSVRLSPSGKLAALVCGNILEVWDLSTHKQRAALSLAHEIWRLAWQPGEQRLAVGCYGGLFLWDIGATNATRLKEGADVAITDLFFDHDGGLLFVGGWHELGEIWDARRLLRVMEPGMGHLVQLSRDQQRIATYREKVGYGISEFLSPLGVRHWPAPPFLGESRWGADLDPQERWLLTAHSQGWLLRDANSGRGLAREQCDLVGSASFSADGSNVLAWTSAGLVRWPLVAASDGTVSVGPKRVFEFPMQEGLNSTCFSANRRFAARSNQGVMMVVRTDDPGQQVSVSLRRPRDSSIHISPDGHWLVTAYNNQPGWDLYDTRSGKFIRTLAEGELPGAIFSPVTGQFFTCSATGIESWQVPEGTSTKRVPWREPGLGVGVLGFAPDGRVALVKSSSSAVQIYDLEAGRDFATLDFRDPQGVYAAHWSRDGQRLFLFGNDGGVTRVDLAALRRELDRLGLNWSDDNPSRDFPTLATRAVPASAGNAAGLESGQPPAWRNPPRLVWFVAAGLLATIGIGHYILRYQRKLFAGFLETESLAKQRASDLRETQAALAHSEKMNALGTMAAGVAHDFNNLLSVIRLSSELIEERTQADETAKENFEAIQHAVQRGRGIVNSMLGYARDDGQPRQFTAAELISESVALLGKSFLGGLVLQVEVQRDTPPLVARKGRVEQMLFNLIVNAADAMRGHGTLTLRARPVREPGACLLPPADAPEFVEFTVQDTGPGIPPEVLPRIFEPFFTTKNKGGKRGTGLGLSMLYSMAKEDGVGVAVETGTGLGTTFRLLLPVEAAQTSKSAVPPSSESAGRADGRPLPDLEARDRAGSETRATQDAGLGTTAAELPAGATRPLAKGLAEGHT